MLYSGTDQKSCVTECTLVYEDKKGLNAHNKVLHARNKRVQALTVNTEPRVGIGGALWGGGG